MTLEQRPLFGEAAREVLDGFNRLAARVYSSSTIDFEPIEFARCFEALVTDLVAPNHITRGEDPRTSLKLRRGDTQVPDEGGENSTSKRRLPRSINSQKLEDIAQTRAFLLARTVLDDALEAQQTTQKTGVLAHSPLHYLRKMLTDPDWQSGEAYANALIRTFLIREAAKRFDVEDATWFPDLQEISESLRWIESHWNRDDNIPIYRNASNFVIGHFLASKGFVLLRFAGRSDPGTADVSDDRSRFFEGGGLRSPIEPEIRVHPGVVRLPDASEIANELFGLPAAVPGLSTVLHGGWRTDENGSSVAYLTGPPGCGKTSFALSLAASLAPVGTKTLYITTEEDPSALKQRLLTLVPPAIRGTHSFPNNLDDWAHFVRAPMDGDDVLDVLTAYIDDFMDLSDVVDGRRPPGTTSALIVIDSINAVRSGSPKSDAKYREFIDVCRDLGCLVFLLSGDNDFHSAGFDYLVDTVLSLGFKDQERLDRRPVRTFTIHKTRRQLSRMGTHVFHLSGVDGFRISPNLFSQLDGRRFFKWREAKTVCKLGFMQSFADLGEIESVRRQPQSIAGFLHYQDFIDLYDGAHILVKGTGSSGKAGFGLRILASPRLGPSRSVSQTKTLVVSFLYPDTYYEKLVENFRWIMRQEADDHGVPYKRPHVDVVYFYPGFLSPEDLVQKIERRLQSARLLGVPYTGILLDGLHNTFLQFPLLDEAPMVWSALFSILRTYGLTVVTTHSFFDLQSGDEESGTGGLDLEFSRRRAAPVLNALVQASDFLIDVSRIASSPVYLREAKAQSVPQVEDLSLVTMRTALGQDLPADPVYWDRVTGALFARITAPLLPFRRKLPSDLTPTRAKRES